MPNRITLSSQFSLASKWPCFSTPPTGTHAVLKHRWSASVINKNSWLAGRKRERESPSERERFCRKEPSLWVWSICGMITTEQSQSTGRTPYPIVILSTTNLTFTLLGSNPGLCDQRSTNNPLKHERTPFSRIWCGCNALSWIQGIQNNIVN